MLWAQNVLWIVLVQRSMYDLINLAQRRQFPIFRALIYVNSACGAFINCPIGFIMRLIRCLNWKCTNIEYLLDALMPLALIANELTCTLIQKKWNFLFSISTLWMAVNGQMQTYPGNDWFFDRISCFKRNMTQQVQFKPWKQQKYNGTCSHSHCQWVTELNCVEKRFSQNISMIVEVNVVQLDKTVSFNGNEVHRAIAKLSCVRFYRKKKMRWKHSFTWNHLSLRRKAYKKNLQSHRDEAIAEKIVVDLLFTRKKSGLEFANWKCVRTTLPLKMM